MQDQSRQPTELLSQRESLAVVGESVKDDGGFVKSGEKLFNCQSIGDFLRPGTKNKPLAVPIVGCVGDEA